MKRTLSVLHDIEIFGESLYGTMARLSRDLDRRQEWGRLRELETATKRALVDAGAPSHEKLLVKWLGIAAGAAAAPLPFRWQLLALSRLIEAGTPLLRRISRSVALAHEGGVLEEYAAHEAEQLAFFRQNL